MCNTEELHQLLPHSPTESLSSAAAYRKCILFLRVNHSDILCPFASAKTTLFFNTVLHTSSARSSFFSGSFAPATRHGTKKEFLTEENCNLNARWRLCLIQTSIAWESIIRQSRICLLNRNWNVGWDGCPKLYGCATAKFGSSSNVTRIDSSLFETFDTSSKSSIN